MATAVYPGSFDPVTLGHLDLVQRACRIFDHVIVAVSNNHSKKHTFSAAERIEMLKNAVRDIPQAEVDTFSGLLVEYLKTKKATTVIRGLRAVSDLEYEFQLASMNRRLYPRTETIFLMPDEQYTYLSSSMVKEVGRMGSALDGMVSPFVAKKLRLKFKIRR
ncbi:MAG: pantetheine-phosphate adenylyltransferase [Elusimicrobia bacterium]|nr:pantetheine-phosphate adenylyltransferase [Elusimicrobiota bacterium]